MPAMNRAQAMVEIMTEVMADPEWAMRIVAAALVAQDQLAETHYRDHPAFDTLVDAFTKEKTA